MSKVTYKDAGVDIHAGYESVERIKKHVKKTFDKNVLSSLGSFGAFYKIPPSYKNPVLVSGTDGVGTKLKLAIMADKHDTVGIDLVAMCVNDVLCQGAVPMFFLDYIACGKNDPAKIEQIVAGIAEGCLQGECALIGGETAEMPGMYAEADYDLAGFAVGIVEEERVITGREVGAGDVLIGLASSGIHSNGFSLVRKLFFDIGSYAIDAYIDELGKTVAEELLTPTRIYVKGIKPLLAEGLLKSVSHITGGGFYENIPRALPAGHSALIDKASFEVPAVFELMAKLGNIDEKEMFSTFNMGVGMMLIVDKTKADRTLKLLQDAGEQTYLLGQVTEAEGGVIFK